jgi:hypothetical protein
MHAFSKPRATTASVRPVAIATAATAAIALTTAVNRPAVTLTAADGIELGSGVSVTPPPGWTVGNQGPGWVTLHNAFSTAEMEIKVKPANGTDPAAVLQNDVSHLSNVSTTGLTNVRDVSAPTAIPLGPGNFQQQATVSYNADGTSVSGPLPVTGWFTELLNPSTHQSAFVVLSQNGAAPVRADGDAQAMLDSMQ